MSRIKKSRTAGNSEPAFNGNRKETSASAKEARERKRKAKLKGNKAGARNVLESKQTQKQNAKKAINDKRVGSKKAVSLAGQEEVQVEAPRKLLQPKAKVIKSTVEKKISPEKELNQIENDQRLNDLLEQLDNGEEISAIDNSWVDKQMARHQQLMEQLGWLDDDGEEDLIQQFEAASSALDEFK
ncbi:GTPase-activating protein [Psychromonas sp. psych-6C06]|uniref:Der GTPase-activating protein YihI n=1 Tax=Psychromonas sp. psych-6C06 TaxID=2058089 RepID=UPI000C340BF7|nr:Der GTPase-activating protein YihI [Psychromonas sp. psych-6C06]PKF61523.1 GTPase-activating protein [Psychromonas sp. psych-6C06]